MQVNSGTEAETSIISAGTSNIEAADLAPSVARARELVEASLPPNTKRSYERSWRCFSDWYSGRFTGDPADATHEMVATYLADLSGEGLLPQSLTVSYAGILFFMQAAYPRRWPPKHRPPSIARVIKGAYQLHGRPVVRKRGLTVANLRTVLAMDLWEGVWLLRARAVLLLGFAGGFRRSELAGLTRGNVLRCPMGLRVLIARSKTDQQGRGRVVPVTFGVEGMCPVAAVQDWCRGARIADGYLFRAISSSGRALPKRMDDKTVSDIVKDAAKALGMDPSKYGGHSLRRGFCTQADRNGKGAGAIMQITGHKSRKMLDVYIEEGRLFENVANEGLFK